jgi:hypothetical protein
MTKIVKRAELVPDASGREVTSDGRIHIDLLADWTIRNGVNSWIKLKDAARSQLHSGVPINQKKIRKQFSKLANELKGRGHRLVVNPHNKEFKIYTGAEIETQFIETKHGYWETRAQRAEEWRDYLGSVIEAA